MTQSNRIPNGGRIDRSKPINFTFNGKNYQGYEGDTLASALLANDVHLVGRSFKYHRPRGIFTAGTEEQNGLVQLGPDRLRTEPNLRTTQISLYEDLNADPQNFIGSVKFDLMAINDVVSPMLPAGFYYKTFMWPRTLWEFYEKFIRRAAGMGRAPDTQNFDPARYDHRYDHCDVLIVGGGISGLSAALSAAKSGARVLLADEQPELGGWLLNERPESLSIDKENAIKWVQKTVQTLEEAENVTLLKRATVSGYYQDNFLTIAERCNDRLHPDEVAPNQPIQRLWKVRARQVILATGMIERHLVFHQNDRPGIMLSGAARAYANRYGVVPGKKPVIVTNNNSAYLTARDLQAAGANIQAIIDTRHVVPDTATTLAQEIGVKLYKGYTVSGTKGRDRVNSLHIQQMDGNGKPEESTGQAIECDLVAISGGWNPAVHLLSHIKGPLKYDPEISSFVPEQAQFKESISAGSCNGSLKIADCLREGQEAARKILKTLDLKPGRASKAPEVKGDYTALDIHPLWTLPAGIPSHKIRAFIDLQNDVTAKDLELAVKEGYTSVEHVKRYTTTGMGTDQGKTGNVTALGNVAQHLGKSIADIGYTTFRPPYSPLTLGAISGRNFGTELYAPVRKTPMHPWHEKHGAIFENVGQWKRPFCYLRAEESEEQAVQREAKAVRTSVGVLDGSTLGKIDIQGPDAPEFLNRIYTNGWSKLKIGRCRYGIMLGEDGMVMDDGVTARIAEDHFHMTTTTGGAARVMAWLEEWHQTEWPELRLQMSSVTDQWAVASIAGPNARNVVQKLVNDIDLSPEALPFMSLAHGHVCGGIPARIFRISFSGESAFEINVPARYGYTLWEQIMSAGENFDITPYGTETMHLLRAEKGFIIVGQDTDGTVTPFDLNMDWIVSGKKDFIGRRSLYRADTLRDTRKKLVGLQTQDPDIILEEGAHIIEKNEKEAAPVPMLGHVTSSYYSPTLKRSIALALIKGGLKRENNILQVDTGAGRVNVRVVQPVFIDPEGARLNA